LQLRLANGNINFLITNRSDIFYFLRSHKNYR
jgi:hypothetical protein